MGLDPQAIDHRVAQTVTDNVYEALVNRDEKGAIIPWLAESWTQVDPTTTRFKLRQGVTFHNGEPFNADAAVFSVKRIIDPALKSQWAANLGTITDARKVDDLTLEIITKEPDAILITRLYTLAMMAPGWTQEAGDETVSTTNGTGPYKVTNWQRAVALDLVANEDYWGGVPSIAAAQIRVIPEDATRLSAVQTGEIDLYLGLLPDQLQLVPAYFSALAPVYSFLRLSNLPGSPIADKRVRQAMNFAVDKDLLLSQLQGGLGNVLPGQVSGEEMFGFNPDLAPYPYDPEQAKSLLREAGAENLEITYIQVKGRYPGDGIEGQAIAEMLAQVGFKVDLKFVSAPEWVKLGDSTQTSPPPAVWYNRHDNMLFDADRTVTGYYTTEGSYSAYDNPEITPLAAQARQELDPEKRKQLYWHIFDLGREDPVGLFLLHLSDLWGATKRIQWQPRADGRAIIKDMQLT